jgi:NarL family two-component system sensor histidine kinase LiaS
VTLELGNLDLENEQLEDEVMAIVTEAVSNALRHSAASKIEVVVEADRPWCRILVRDDGRGFDPGAVREGMGLSNLSARASRLGGSADISTASGAGTTVEVQLPLS